MLELSLSYQRNVGQTSIKRRKTVAAECGHPGNGNPAPGLWDGSGIVTSQTDATTGNYHSIGIATADQVKGIAASDTSVWAGQTVSGTDTLVMYTYGGDANLDGKINIDDYGVIDFNVGIQSGIFFAGSGSGGRGGDGLTAVPEPAFVGVLMPAAALLVSRRRRARIRDLR